MNPVGKKLSVFGGAALIVLILDQLTKYWIRTSPELHQYTLIEGWLAFNFTKNPGMAMGIDWADTWVISLIAIAATIVILVYVWKTMKPAGTGYMVCMGMIIGGALGNIADRIFMARVGGYGGVLDGHVVDFIHFKLEIGNFAVFPYIFNVADSAITVAIVTLIVFYKKLIPEYQTGASPKENPVSGSSGNPQKEDERWGDEQAGSPDEIGPQAGDSQKGAEAPKRQNSPDR